MIETTARPKTILIKFQFTNSKLIPMGIREYKRDENQIEEKHTKEANALGINKGAVRENVVDTGIHTKGYDISIKPFVVQLFKTGYFLSDIHYFRREQKYNTRYILILTFAYNGRFAFIPRSTLSGIFKFIEKDAWGICHFWRNPSSIWTINCLHRLPDKATAPEIGKLFFEAPDDNQTKYIHEKI